jgi:hypothetical protein
MDSLNEATVSHLQTEMNVTPKYENVAGQTTDSKIDSLMSLLDTYLPVLADGMNVTLEGGAEKIFNVVKNENKIYKRMNGQSAFA